MKALVFERTGDPTTFSRIENLPIPNPVEWNSRPRATFAGSSPRHAHHRGRFGLHRPTTIPGIECFGGFRGTRGRCVAGLAPGTRVVLLNVFVVRARSLVSPADGQHLPAIVFGRDAAQALVNPITAGVMTMVRARS